MIDGWLGSGGGGSDDGGGGGGGGGLRLWCIEGKEDVDSSRVGSIMMWMMMSIFIAHGPIYQRSEGDLNYIYV